MDTEATSADMDISDDGDVGQFESGMLAAARDPEKPASKPKAKTAPAKSELSDDIGLDWLKDIDDGDDEEATNEADEEESDVEENEEPPEDEATEAEEALVTKEGKPVSKKANEAFQEVKRQKTEAEQRAIAAEKERDEFRKQLDAIDFRNSDEFKKTFDEPINKLSIRANNWLSTVSPDKANEVKLAISEARSYLAAGGDENRQKYFNKIDEISENYLRGTSGRKFSDDMEEIWEKYEQRKEAFNNHEKAAEEIRNKRLQKFASSGRSIEASIDSEMDSFQKREPLVGFYRREDLKERFQYDDIVPAQVESIKKELKDFASSGVVTPGLANFLIAAAHAPIRDSERQMLTASITKFHTELELKKKEVEALSRRIEKITGKKINNGSSRPSSSSGKSREAFSYGMVGALDDL